MGKPLWEKKYIISGQGPQLKRCKVCGKPLYDKNKSCLCHYHQDVARKRKDYGGKVMDKEARSEYMKRYRDNEMELERLAKKRREERLEEKRKEITRSLTLRQKFPPKNIDLPPQRFNLLHHKGILERTKKKYGGKVHRMYQTQMFNDTVIRRLG
jgi:hypothetical protein